MTQFEHVYHRPDMYIGAVETVEVPKWIWNEEKNRAELKNIVFNPGLFSILREIGSNVIDNKWRSEKDKSSPLMKKITITTDPDTGEITFLNDGYCIPVHKETYTFTSFKKDSYELDLYPAEVFFGHMGAGTNFDDTKERKTSGKNGMGSKLTNIFSTEFVVEHTSPEDQAKFVQKHWDNGKECSKPKVTKCTRKTGYTKISFIPDYECFGYPSKEEPGIDETLVAVIRMYAYEIAMLTGVPVQFNGEKLSIKNLEDYAKIFYPPSKDRQTAHLTSESGDECVIVEKLEPKTDEVDKIDHVSFINGIQTFGGGIHVDAWEKAIITPFVTLYNQKAKKNTPKTTGNLVKPYFTLFIRAEIDKPKFESNSKSQLVGPCDSKNKPMYKVKATESFKSARKAVLQKMMKWNFIVLLEEKLRFREERSKKKGETQRLISNSNIDHANKAGTKESLKCILCIEEGKSAKGLMDSAIGELRTKDSSGKEIIGTDYYGSMAIRGKFLNVQNSTMSAIFNNAEVQLLINALGLRYGIDYSKDENLKTLRYGEVWIVTDADDDGIHIRALLINFFYKLFKSLFDRGFIKAFNTPVVKLAPRAKRDRDNRNKWLLFYTNPEFRRYHSQHDLKGWVVQYYKGLGSIPVKESDLYLKNPKIVTFFLEGDESEYMSLGFDKKDADRRKQWIARGMPREGEFYEYFKKVTAYEDDSADSDEEEPHFVYEGRLSLSCFIDHQLIIYHRMTLRRHLPCIWDGFTESQRKAFYGIRKARLTSCQTLGRLAGEIQRDTAYHHGPDSLMGTIIRMAQGFVGTNNIPLLIPNGNFGSRKKGGKDHAAPRYPSTMLEHIASIIFPEIDDALLTQLEDTDGKIEYSTYYPIIPMILVNGATGLACGSSTEIPCYNPEELVNWLITRLSEPDKVDKLKAIEPWYRGFVGEIEMVTPKDSVHATGWISKGILERGQTKKDKDWWHIRELPIGLWPVTFKDHLEFLQTGNPPEGSRRKKSIKCLKEVRNYNKKNSIHFVIKPTKNFIPDVTVSGNLKILQKKHNLKNMVVIDEKNYPYRFQSVEQILECFYMRRLEIYSKRKEYLLNVYQKDLKKASNRYRFVCSVGIERTLDLHGFETDEELYISMKEEYKFDLVDDTYDYLLNMAVRSLTRKKAEELAKEKEKLKNLIGDLKKKTPKDLWLTDLEKFKVEYKKFLKERDD